jgi:hypothetical protein
MPESYLNCRVPDHVQSWFLAESLKRGVSRSSLVRVALLWYMAKNREGLYAGSFDAKSAGKAGVIPLRLVAPLSRGGR